MQDQMANSPDTLNARESDIPAKEDDAFEDMEFGDANTACAGPVLMIGTDAASATAILLKLATLYRDISDCFGIEARRSSLLRTLMRDAFTAFADEYTWETPFLDSPDARQGILSLTRHKRGDRAAFWGDGSPPPALVRIGPDDVVAAFTSEIDGLPKMEIDPERKQALATLNAAVGQWLATIERAQRALRNAAEGESAE